MCTPTTGEIRPKSVLSIPVAAELASHCKRLSEEVDNLTRSVADLKTDNPGIRELFRISRRLDSVALNLGACHLDAQSLWDTACAAADRTAGGAQ